MFIILLSAQVMELCTFNQQFILSTKPFETKVLLLNQTTYKERIKATARVGFHDDEAVKRLY